MPVVNRYDVVIIGAGLAGLSLARQLLQESDKRILLLEKRASLPPPHQKVGEATVQLSAYYFSKVLDLEEYLLREHYMKYNLRFFWKTPGRENRCLEDFSQSYIRNLSNIASYQLNRNKIEGELLRLNLENKNFTLRAPIAGLNVSIGEGDSPHALSFTGDGGEERVEADWVVDTSGRGKVLARKMGLEQQNPIRHGAAFFWVEGLLNIEKLTDLSPKEIRLKKDRAATGHLPMWLATNHFCGEGFWFWVIPLHSVTSLGLVYDNRLIARELINTPEKLIAWVCEEFPLFARDLPHRKILDHSAIKDFSYGCKQTISGSRWAVAGEAGRFTDPLYSPGGDLIALYNTMIVDSILTTDAGELATKVRLYEQLMETLYEAYVPTYATSYDALGDQEAMTLKYTWELAVYFSFYVFPFINDLFTERHFALSFIRRFSQLGLINKKLQAFISAFYQWKRANCRSVPDPVFNDFMELGPLRTAESTFYQVGLSVEGAREVLDVQLDNLRELACYIVAHIYSVVLGDERVLTNRSFVGSITLEDFSFDPGSMREHYAKYENATGQYRWSFDPFVLKRFRPAPSSANPPKPYDQEVTALAEEGGVAWTTMHL
jgi:flavin-dependent dehydrogenase